MDIETVTETPSVESSAEVVTTSPAEAATPAIDSATDVTTEAVQAVEEQFVPNYKYKAYGKELEMDEWARPLLNKDTQPHLQKLFEKAGGFDHLKEEFQATKSQFSEYHRAYTELDGVRNQILSLVEKKDLNQLGAMLGLTKEDFKNHVRSLLEYEGLPAAEKRAIDERNQLIQQQHLAQQQLSEQQSYAQQVIMEKHELEMQMTFSNPKYAPLINNYNQRLGDENAFRGLVDKIGAAEYYQTGRNMTVSEATEQALNMLGMQASEMITQQVSQAQAPQATSMNAPQGRPAPKPIVVPSGSSASPVKKGISTWDDLKRAQNEAFNN